MTRGRVVIVGGGLAGIASALGCRDAGFDVTLLEARPRLGGATYSFRRNNLTVDTGQHVFLRCYTAYTALLHRLGTLGHTRVQRGFRVPVLRPDAPGWVMRRANLPAPAHLLPALLGHRTLTWRERVTAGRTALALRGLDPDDPALDDIDFRTWLRGRGESERAVATLWGMFCVAALNAPPDQASLGPAVKVFRTGMLDTSTGVDIGVVERPLSEVHGAPALRCLRRAGIDVRLRSKVTDVDVDEHGHHLVTPEAGAEPLRADSVVLAVPHAAAAKLLAGRTLPNAVDWTDLTSAPIVNVHAHFDRPVTDLELAATVDSPVQWLFDRTRAAGADRGQYLVVSLSAAQEVVSERSARLRERFLPALSALLPRVRQAHTLDFFVTREPAATFLPEPGSRALRPRARTGVPGLVLAGAWTDTGWPDTLEGAVRSGDNAARVVAETVDSDRSVARR